MPVDLSLILCSPPPRCPPDLLCSRNEVLNLLLHLPFDTATDPDEIISRMLRSAFSIASPLTHIFNLSLQSGTFPSDWKFFHIVLIPKTKSSSSSPSDYHPISLLPIISKVLEQHVFNFLSEFCTQHNLLSNS